VLGNRNSVKGIPLSDDRSETLLQCNDTPVSDLSPVQDCKGLKTLLVPRTKVTAAGVAALQKALPNCKIEWDGQGKGPVASGQGLVKSSETPAFQQWVKATQALPAEKQIEAEAKKLMELNPGFDGKVTPTIENGVVIEVKFSANNMADISPVRALASLRGLTSTSNDHKGLKLSDLSPLAGTKLASLNCTRTEVADLSPLRDMPITRLTCGQTMVSDLSPLAGTPLKALYCGDTLVSNLMPLKECKNLEVVRVTSTKVTAADVAALQKALPNCKIDWDDPAKAKTPQP